MLNETLPLQLSIDISLLIEYLFDTLIEANYIPDYLTNEYAHTLEFLSATTFNQHGTSPYPKSRPLKRILFRNQYSYDLTRHLQFILREPSHWPVHHQPPPHLHQHPNPLSFHQTVQVDLLNKSKPPNKTDYFNTDINAILFRIKIIL